VRFPGRRPRKATVAATRRAKPIATPEEEPKGPILAGRHWLHVWHETCYDCRFVWLA
jgi:hypothetical protein